MKNWRIELKWAIIFMAAALLWMVFERLMGWHGSKIAQHPIYTNLFAILAVGLYVTALRDKRDHFFGGKMTWQQGFISGIVISVLVAFFSPLSQYITHKVITPDFFPNAISYAVREGKLTQEAAEAYFNLGSYIWQSTIGALVMGLVTAAIVAFFVRKS